jgi:hypothetical protein
MFSCKVLSLSHRISAWFVAPQHCQSVKLGSSKYDETHDGLTGAGCEPHRGEAPLGFTTCKDHPLASKGEVYLTSDVAVVRGAFWSTTFLLKDRGCVSIIHMCVPIIGIGNIY